jgi:5-methylcytosine-specific restriction endonuclease McrA
MNKIPSPNTKKMSMKRKPISSKTYKRFALKNKKCKKCHKRFNPNILEDAMELHHIIPIKNGGTNTQKNLIALCGFCHWKEHSDEFTYEQFFDARRNRQKEEDCKWGDILNESSLINGEIL